MRSIRRIAGCQVAYDGEDVFMANFSVTTPPLPPVTWAEALFGKDFVHRAGTVGLPGNRVDEVMPHLGRLPYLRRVIVLKTDETSESQVKAAADKITHAMPWLDTVLLEFDFNIEDTLDHNAASDEE